MQPLLIDEDAVIRFKGNGIVNSLYRLCCDNLKFGMNEIVGHGGYTEEDLSQFAQLLGYSVDGYGELDYVSKKSIRKADKKADKLREIKSLAGSGMGVSKGNE